MHFVLFEMADACLFVMTARKLLWINLGDLLALGKEEVVDWESLSSPPPSFSSANVPDVDENQETHHHFVFDSELYVAVGGLINPCHIGKYVGGISRREKTYVPGRGLTYIYDIEECLAKVPSCKIYRVDVENRKCIAADLISRPPTPFAPCFMGNISGDVYLLVFYRSDLLEEAEGLWVLSSSGKWQPLSPPLPPFDLRHSDFSGCHCFVFQDKLFFRVYMRKVETLMYSFDPSTAAWTTLDEDTTHSFSQYFPETIGKFCFPSVTMSRLSNCSVALSWSLTIIPGGDREIEVMIDAFLVNNQNGAVILCQRLDDCLKGIRPTSFAADDSHFSFVDLGNGMVCALLYGYTPNHDEPVLCISVFTLTVIEANIDINTDTDVDIGTEAPRKDFLSVSVQVKRVFTMKDYEYSWMMDSFIFTPKKEMLASEVRHAPLLT